MSRHAVAKFGIEAWDEQPWHEGQDGRKLTRATVTKMYSVTSAARARCST